MWEVLSAITMMGWNLPMVMSALQSTTCPIPQGFAHQPAIFANSQMKDQPHPGAAGNICYMCIEMAHFLNHCPILLEYIQLCKADRNAQNMVMLDNGDPIPSDLTTFPWAT